LKTRFPLFARLLLWFFLNVVAVLTALFLTLHFQFGSQFNSFLPDTSHSQTQAMAEVLMHDLATTPKGQWDQVLSRLGAAYHMDFALFNKTGMQLAGVPMNLPANAVSMILMTAGQGPPGLPLGPPGAPDQPPGFPPPAESGGALPLRLGPGRMLPDFPQRVIRTDNPEMFWLLVHLPLNRFQTAGLESLMLVGKTGRLGESPLLFNPHPWFILTIGAIIYSALFWLPLTRNLTGAIAKMTQATEEIAEGRFDIQAPEKRGDELGRLGLAINRMAARLKGFVTGQRRFLGDVAHELCSPLARMEVALGILEERADEKTVQYVRDVREEVTRMRKLAHELLSFSRAALGENQVGLVPVSVAEVIAQAVRQEHCINGQVIIEAGDDLQVLAHPDLLCRALANLLRNGIRYAGYAGPILITARKEQDEIVIAVADGGRGVPAPELERLFDPFYRLDESRDSDTGGTGLGLAIVKTCVETCGGKVAAFNRVPSGLEVELRFPARL
jgi:two-component system sensor histidine kinase CpxA